MEDAARKIERLEAQVRALTQMVLCLMVTSPTAEDALHDAATQRESLFAKGRTEAAMIMDDMLDTASIILDLPYRP